MKTFASRRLRAALSTLALVAICAASTAQAAEPDVIRLEPAPAHLGPATGELVGGGQAEWKFSAKLVNALNSFHASISTGQGAQHTTAITANPTTGAPVILTSSITLPLLSLDAQRGSGLILQERFGGSLTFSIGNASASVSAPASLTLSDFRISYSEHLIYARLADSNGHLTPGEFSLFQFSTPNGVPAVKPTFGDTFDRSLPTCLPGEGIYPCYSGSLSGNEMLISTVFTQQGFNAIATGLNLTLVGKGVLNQVNQASLAGAGTIQISSVPETSTWAMSAIGLLLIAGTALRRHASGAPEATVSA